MDDRTIQELFARQGQVIATLALRVTTLEVLLLEKGSITEEEVVKKATELSKEFTVKTQEAIQKALEAQKAEGKTA